MFILVLLAFIVGFVVGRANIPTPLNSVIDTVSENVKNKTGEDTTKAPTTQSNTQGSANVSEKLTDGQRKMLQSFGINPNEVTITPTMITCAEAKVGKARVAEITNGATPSLLEGASLIACYK